MKKMIWAVAVILTGWVLPGFCQGEATPELKAILEKVDKLYRAGDSYAELEMTIVNPNWQRTLVMNMWSRGMKKSFIRILSPAKDRGVATLRDHQDMWNYFPKIDKVMKVPPSMMMSSWMGSDFTNDDLVKETTLLDDYDGKLITPEGASGDKYYVELKPKQSTASVWGRIVMAVNRSDLLPVSEEYYDEKGTLMRHMEFRDVREFSGRRIPAVMEIIPLNKPGNKTIIEYKKAVFDQGVSDEVFSLRNLQKKL